MSEYYDVSVHEVPEMQNVLMWDAVEREWLVGHMRKAGELYACACTVAEAAEMLVDGVPVPVFAEVTHWARLPDAPGEPA